MNTYDICIIGGGPSGYAAAMRALDFNLSVILIEKKRLGGAGLHQGALSSKTFWEISRTIRNTRQNLKKFGHGEIFIPFRAIVEEVHAAVGEREKILQDHLDQINQSLNHNNCRQAWGLGSLVGKNQVKITFEDGSSEEIWARNIILATGSRPRFLPNIPIDENIIVTSDGLENWEEYPESMVVVGAGVIGCEYATVMSNLGQTRVFLIDKADHILPFEDEDLVQVVEENLEKNGVVIHRNSSLTRMEIVDGQVEYELEYNDGHKEVFQVEKALVSVGRVPNVEGLGLELLGVAQTSRGYIDDDDSATNVPGIYAVGDLTADLALVNVGELEGRHAVEKIMGVNKGELNYENISTIMFLNPETAGVGMNEQQARDKGVPYKVVSIDYSCIPRAIAMRDHRGFFKILVTDDDEMRILGMRAIGEHASSAIQAVALLISMEKGIDELSELIHPHPSIIEGVQECARMLKGKSILKPEVFTHALTCRRFANGAYSGIS
ncbi:MAG: NAD(P)/FAD-dependent oxidoreductase [Bacteroidia bacterium]|nr:NAD(P)/FAD-dependent oxidoreductase [Bacteroidia bacterium]